MVTSGGEETPPEARLETAPSPMLYVCNKSRLSPVVPSTNAFFRYGLQYYDKAMLSQAVSILKKQRSVMKEGLYRNS